MRDATELRESWLAELRVLFPRAGMYATSGREMATVLSRRLRDLCFLDEREDEHEQVVEVLRRRYGKLGVSGPVEAVFGAGRSYDEVASVYAEQFHRLGYLPVEHRQVTASVREWVGARDVRLGEVEAAFGPPSLVVGKRILCYAPADGGGWVFVDCWDQPASRYVPDAGRYEALTEEDPLVRSIRVPADTFEDGLVLTLFGRVLRWGPGWWINHPGPHTSDETAAIAAQLRQVEAADPASAQTFR